MIPLCYGCFKPLKGNESTCPHCGYHIHENPDSANILKPGTVLNQKYTIGKTLGVGGFGITYLAWDNNLQTKIAIKEFFPAKLVARGANSENNTTIYTISKAYSDEFHSGMDRFVKEAAVLAKFFKLQGIVSVKDFFYENGTAYIVMEYIDGISLKEYLKQKGGRLSVEETLTLMKPVMESLAIIHKEKVLHRDISPDNLMVSTDFQVTLIDFGSARNYDLQSDMTMTVVLKHGYAPIEQYSPHGNQGTWTDVYGLCATMYRMLTGKVPDIANDRIINDGLVPVKKFADRIPANIDNAIMKGLSIMLENRQQTVEELYHELYISRQELRTEKRGRAYQRINKFLTVMIVVLVLAIGVSVIAFANREKLQEVISGFFDDEIDLVDDGEDEGREDDQSPEDDAETEVYQLIPPDAEQASQTYPSVAVVKDGRLNNIAEDYTVGEILDSYSDIEGVWYTYDGEKDSQTYVYYKGQRDGVPFAFEFEAYTNGTFTLTDASRDDAALERYSDFFQEILDSLGLD